MLASKYTACSISVIALLHVTFDVRSDCCALALLYLNAENSRHAHLVQGFVHG